MNQLFRHLATRVAGMLGIGRVTGQNDGGTVQSVQYQTPLEVATARRITEFGFSSALPAGSDVVLAFLGGDRSSPVIIGSNHQGHRHTGLNPGETVLYNQWGLYILMTEKGITVEANGQDVTVNNARNLTVTATEQVKLITPKLLVTGDVVDNCESNPRTLKELRDAYNGHNHVTKGVAGGSSSITSEKTAGQVT
ncbi:phage baseplate assembly protein domain-containing protein [Citrobacter rodentium]|uniref:Phage baseplate assembly protein n=2 Tax=Citrobacter rodentium TaxID=67825 RepID=D2TUQ7_CITRI|nr:phage baseplate assembly protein [Citrobacter rodentium]KIQ49001.1 baseplate assembly protein [Citrobacter rodentium]UHO29072.1 phage baseplate assembly protein [Citrobacter rodentium NBRC 105723 = DSM 16636]WOZ57171.1 baseplate assembly protein [Citrobacter phage phiNP]CBG89326.1 putative phage baseplate assembly protein [Citrobacter rodentium ICC168]